MGIMDIICPLYYICSPKDFGAVNLESQGDEQMTVNVPRTQRKMNTISKYAWEANKNPNFRIYRQDCPLYGPRGASSHVLT